MREELSTMAEEELKFETVCTACGAINETPIPASRVAATSCEHCGELALQ